MDQPSHRLVGLLSLGVASTTCAICHESLAPGRAASRCAACQRLFDWLRDHVCIDGDIPSESVTPQSSFAADIRLDSLSMIELIIDLEGQFGVAIANDAVSDVRTVEDVIRYVRVHVPAA